MDHGHQMDTTLQSKVVIGFPFMSLVFHDVYIYVSLVGAVLSTNPRHEYIVLFPFATKMQQQPPPRQEQKITLVCGYYLY